VQAAIPARPKLGAPASAWADYNAAISAAGIRFQDKLDADFVAKAQPVQAAYTAEDYHDARLHGSYGNAAEIAEALASASDLSPSVRDAWLAVSAKMRAKAQPVQAASSTPGPWEIWGNVGEMDLAVGPVAGGVAVAQIVTVNGIGIMSEESAQLGAANARLIAAAPALLAALETVHEAGRMSDQPRAVYCSLIAQDALNAAKGGAQ